MPNDRGDRDSMTDIVDLASRRPPAWGAQVTISPWPLNEAKAELTGFWGADGSLPAARCRMFAGSLRRLALEMETTANLMDVTVVSQEMPTPLALPALKDWRYPQWHEVEPGVWHLIQKGATGWSGELVGEAYAREDGGFKWHCKTSDWRDSDAKSIEQAKAECEASFWKEAWHQATGHQR